VNIHIVGQGAGYQVKEIAAVLRASREYDGRGWRTIELAATADVTPGADIEQAHNDLYEQLRRRMVMLLGKI
jgi:hypothetical protein